MAAHALLSASSSRRWINCPPSAKLNAEAEKVNCETNGEYAKQGTEAHALCEYKLKIAIGMESTDPTENLSFYDEEMERCAEEYKNFCLSVNQETQKTCKDPVILIEEKLDFSNYVPNGFGTGDCVIIGDGTLHVIDYKHGQGVEVVPERKSSR